MRDASIRLRLAAWYLGVLLTALVLFAGGIWLALRHQLVQSLEATLADRTDGLVQFLELESPGSDLAAVREETREYASGLPEADTLSISELDGSLVFGSPSRADTLYSRREVVTIHGYPLVIEWNTPLSVVNDALDSLRNILLASIPAVVLFAAFGGWWLSRKALKPVDQMTRAAESISADDLSARLEVPASGDEIERLGRAWNRMLDRIELSVKQTRQLTADAAHELRTPVAVIRTASELAVRRERSPAQYRTTLNEIEDEARRMSDLLDALLWLARDDAARSLFSIEDVRVIDVISEAYRAVESLAESCHVQPSLDVQVDPDRTVRGDRNALRRVILILADNAIKFTPAGGFVRIRVSVADSSCRIEVEDSGIGIDNDDLPRIFDRFYRGDRARRSPGSGLGLSIAAAIVRHHDGSIRARNLPGAGSCFEACFPLGQPCAPVSDALEHAAPQT